MGLPPIKKSMRPGPGPIARVTKSPRGQRILWPQLISLAAQRILPEFETGTFPLEHMASLQILFKAVLQGSLFISQNQHPLKENMSNSTHLQLKRRRECLHITIRKETAIGPKTGSSLIRVRRDMMNTYRVTCLPRAAALCKHDQPLNAHDLKDASIPTNEKTAGTCY